MNNVAILDDTNKEVIVLHDTDELKEFLDNLFEASAKSFGIQVDCTITEETRKIRIRINNG